MKLSAEEVAAATGGQILQSAPVNSFESFSIDSRKMKQGGLFFAIKGENTDGHLFVEAARQNGAAGAVVDHPVATNGPFFLLKVVDSLKALQDLAASVRSTSRSKFIGITGSSGKTSTKEFAASLLSSRFSVFKSEGNLNSITGMPLSLLSFNQQECAVFEIGMNQPGEIIKLSELLKPHVGVVLNVNPVHIGQFPSLEAIGDEKFSLTGGLTENGDLVFNVDDPLLKSRVVNLQKSKISYGFAPEADLRIVNVHSMGVRGIQASFMWNKTELQFQTRLCGQGNLYNIAAATAVSLLFGLGWNDIKNGIFNLRPYSQRGVLLPMSGFDIYDDSYNSNPRALEIALNLIAESEGYKRKIAILGDMLELGPEEIEFHREAGRQVALRNFDVLITAGPLSRNTAEAAARIAVHPTSNSEEAGQIAAALVREGDLVLVKGSRGMKMERVIERLKEVKR